MLNVVAHSLCLRFLVKCKMSLVHVINEENRRKALAFSEKQILWFSVVTALPHAIQKKLVFSIFGSHERCVKITKKDTNGLTVPHSFQTALHFSFVLVTLGQAITSWALRLVFVCFGWNDGSMLFSLIHCLVLHPSDQTVWRFTVKHILSGNFG